MFRYAASGAIVVVAMLVLALAGPTSAGDTRSGVRGEVTNATCYGPCYPADTGRPYAGEATIVADPRSRRAQRAETAVEGGGFRVRLQPGRYRVSVRIDDPCWLGDSDKLRVHRDEFRHLRLEVSNDCIR